MADTKCPSCGGPASQPIMEIYCLNNCGGKVEVDNVLFKWQDNQGFWWMVEKVTEGQMLQNQRFIFYPKNIGTSLDTFDTFCKIGWIDPVSGEPDNTEYWDKNRVGWGQFNIRRITLL